MLRRLSQSSKAPQDSSPLSIIPQEANVVLSRKRKSLFHVPIKTQVRSQTATSTGTRSSEETEQPLLSPGSTIGTWPSSPGSSTSAPSSTVLSSPQGDIFAATDKSAGLGDKSSDTKSKASKQAPEAQCENHSQMANDWLDYVPIFSYSVSPTSPRPRKHPKPQLPAVDEGTQERFEASAFVIQRCWKSWKARQALKERLLHASDSNSESLDQSQPVVTNDFADLVALLGNDCVAYIAYRDLFLASDETENRTDNNGPVPGSSSIIHPATPRNTFNGSTINPLIKRGASLPLVSVAEEIDHTHTLELSIEPSSLPPPMAEDASSPMIGVVTSTDTPTPGRKPPMPTRRPPDDPSSTPKPGCSRQSDVVGVINTSPIHTDVASTCNSTPQPSQPTDSSTPVAGKNKLSEVRPDLGGASSPLNLQLPSPAVRLRSPRVEALARPTSHISAFSPILEEVHDRERGHSTPNGSLLGYSDSFMAASARLSISDYDETAPLPVSDISNLVNNIDNDPVGFGGFCDLFVGEHVTHGKVAMKRPRFTRYDPAINRRFCREADLWCPISHPNILPFLGTCKIGRSIYLVSPYIENGDLAHCIRNGRVLDRGRLLCEIAEAIAHLHSIGIVHGDIKAQNVLVSDDEAALLCDFGLAKAFTSMATSTEARGRGSTRWMAPELHHEHTKTKQTDVYAYGMTIAEVLSGDLPFSHIANDSTVIYQVLHHQARPQKVPKHGPDGESYLRYWEVAAKCWVTRIRYRPTMAQVTSMLDFSA